MAVLPDLERAELHANFMRVDLGTIGACSKNDIRAAVNALDDFLVANASAINAAIPQPARGALTVAQKAYLLNLVIQRRYITGA